MFSWPAALQLPQAKRCLAWSVDFCMGVLPMEPACAGSFADDSAGDAVPSESLPGGLGGGR